MGKRFNTQADNAKWACTYLSQSNGYKATAVKMEFEAQTYRDDTREDCDSCEDGNYHLDCDTCDATGVVTLEDDNHEPQEVNCEDCDGRGYLYETCEDCMGSGYQYTHWDDERFYDGFYNRLSERAREGITYGHCYNDGSVDTEVTVTSRIEYWDTWPELAEAFWDTCQEASGGDTPHVRNAGMHMTLINSPDGTYPDRCHTNTAKFANFKRSMNDLLPALYFLATPDPTTRGFSYRPPEIKSYGHHENSGYSAIEINGGAIEFRIFDTCYENPYTILDNFIVMAKCMQYHSDTYIKPPVKFKGAIKIGSSSDRTALEDMFRSPNQLDALNQGLLALKPDYLTIGEIKTRRGFKNTKISTQRAVDRYVKNEVIKEWMVYAPKQALALEATKKYAEYRWYVRQIEDPINTAPMQEFTDNLLKERMDRSSLEGDYAYYASFDHYKDIKVNQYISRQESGNYTLEIGAN